MDQVVTSFTEEDVRQLGDNVVLILNTVKAMTQPEIMNMVNNYHGSGREVESDELPTGMLDCCPSDARSGRATRFGAHHAGFEKDRRSMAGLQIDDDWESRRSWDSAVAPLPMLRRAGRNRRAFEHNHTRCDGTERNHPEHGTEDRHDRTIVTTRASCRSQRVDARDRGRDRGGGGHRGADRPPLDRDQLLPRGLRGQGRDAGPAPIRRAPASNERDVRAVPEGPGQEGGAYLGSRQAQGLRLDRVRLRVRTWPRTPFQTRTAIT